MRTILKHPCGQTGHWYVSAEYQLNQTFIHYVWSTKCVLSNL